MPVLPRGGYQSLPHKMEIKSRRRRITNHTFFSPLHSLNSVAPENLPNSTLTNTSPFSLEYFRQLKDAVYRHTRDIYDKPLIKYQFTFFAPNFQYTKKAAVMPGSDRRLTHNRVSKMPFFFPHFREKFFNLFLRFL